MNKNLRNIVSIGLTKSAPDAIRRTVMLSNALAFIAIVLCSSLLLYMLIRNDWQQSRSINLIALTVLLLTLVPILNLFKKFILSRFLMSILMPIMSVLISLYPRMLDPENYTYLPRSPILFSVLIVTSIVPLMLFSRREMKFIIPAMLINVGMFLLLDPANFYFSADRNVASYTALRFLGNNIILIIVELFLIGSILFFKNLFEHFERENEKLLLDLNQKNIDLQRNIQELHQLNQDIEAQNEEIQAQSEELMLSQESLTMANQEIERQRAELQQKNILLEKSVDEKSADLLQTN